MALAAGSRLGPYEIVSLLGHGAMGEVYNVHPHICSLYDRWFVHYPFRNFDLSPDGTRFLFIEDEPPPVTVASRIQVVVNWTEVLRNRAPEGHRR